MHRTRRFAPVAAMAVLVVACSADRATSPAPSTPPAGHSDMQAMSETPTAAPSASAAEPIATASEEAPGDELLAVRLTDVRTGADFTLGELAASGGPVLLEPMAVWCSSCRAQQHEVKGAHEQGGAFTSVSLDVDLSESPGDLAGYADREGFDWRFAMADAALYRLLQDRFGVGVTNPPLTPLIVVEPDGTVRALEFGRGVRDAELLLAEIGAG
jgi:hypothetical protein